MPSSVLSGRGSSLLIFCATCPDNPCLSGVCQRTVLFSLLSFLFLSLVVRESGRSGNQIRAAAHYLECRSLRSKNVGLSTGVTWNKRVAGRASHLISSNFPLASDQRRKERKKRRRRKEEEEEQAQEDSPTDSHLSSRSNLPVSI